ncbi:hypothetical protein SEUCBS140593_005507 [Sporothrix eucalyptigena]|uniref:Xylanolytic transcriptional activator regulatory domain-containing protein n=1 Tax=Sporothrix eucalyptigena TaxID=1812306 RepID=A0ABP0BXB9_9PEZI
MHVYPACQASWTAGTADPSRTPFASAPYGQYERSIPPDVITSLVEVYYHANYPIRPYFHWPTYEARIEKQMYRTDWNLFVVTMAVCSLAAARLCDGFTIGGEQHPLLSEAASLSAICYNAAMDCIPADITSVPDDFQMMRVQTILASTCFQKRDLRKAIFHHGNYTTLSVCSAFHDEANWPPNLSVIETEERRRLFWGNYQSEQWTSNSFNGVPRQREARAVVRYPAEVFDDEDLEVAGPKYRPGRVSFLQGWNFCTDLYRLIENIDHDLQTKAAMARMDESQDQTRITSFMARRNPTPQFASDSLHLITECYERLPMELRKVQPPSGNAQADRLGIIASNILITAQTLKLLLAGAEASSIHQRCAIAAELLDDLSAIPIAFLHSINTVSLQHLAHVGHLLSSVIKSPLSTWAYLQVRNILLVFADLLHKIESTRTATPNLATQLHDQIRRIDRYMEQHRQGQQHTTGVQATVPEAPMGQNLMTGWTRSPPTGPPADVSSVSAAPLTTASTSTGPLTGQSNTLSYNILQTPFPESVLPATFSDSPRPPSMLSMSFDNILGDGLDGQTAVSAGQPITLPSDILDNWQYFINQTDAFNATLYSV